VIAAFAVLALMACGGAPEASASAEGSVGASAEAATPADEGSAAEAKPMKVTLEKGWRMQDVISPEDVGAITGKEMKYFAEAAASSKNGRPAAGYTVPGVSYSKIGFRAYVDFGEKEYEIHRQYAVEGTLEEVPGVGDKAYVMNLEDGTISIVTLVDETVIRISWFAETWPDVDRVEFGSRLANMLIEKITG
jgi:hypothetical protein